MKKNIAKKVAVAGVLALAGLAHAGTVQVRVTVENLAGANGVAISPVTLIAHDGSFDAFNAGASASLGVQNVAEFGNGADLIAAATGAQASAVTGVATASVNGFGPGIYLPGGSGSIVLNLDPAANRYLSYGAMVVPSNDSFIGNANALAVELFNASGDFVGQSFTLSGGDIWDAGTEVNQLFGSAFIVGQDAGDHDAENGSVMLANDFSRYLGLNTPAGYAFGGGPGANDGVVRFSFQVVPAPGVLGIAGLGSLVALRRKR